MSGGRPTEKEQEILRMLLAKHGITRYALIETVGEGKVLPGRSGSEEIESMSGIVVTPTTHYSFWLDWEDGHYTLGEEDGIWEEGRLEDWNLSDRKKILQTQRQLREEEQREREVQQEEGISENGEGEV